MTPETDRDRRGQPPEGDAYVRQQFASIDGSLFNGMPMDDRYESGVPETQRGNSLDFIQMTGLTRPPLRQASRGIEGSLAQTPIYEDLNPSEPLSFYEKGVADVDDTLGGEYPPGGLRDATLDIDLVPNRNADLSVEGGASRSAQAFRDIVAGLQRGDVAPAEATPAADDFDPGAEEFRADKAEAYGGSTSGALLALVEELEAVMGVEPAPAAPVEAVAEAAPVLAAEEASPEHIEEASPVTVETVTPLAAPAAEIGDEDFDALLSSLSGRGETSQPETLEDDVAESAPLEDEAAPGISDDWDALLDSMSVRGADPEPAPVIQPALKKQSSDALAEAEQLMQALEKRPPSVPPASGPAPEPELAATPVSTPPVETVPAGDAGRVVPASVPTALDTRMRERAEASPGAMAVQAPPGGIEGEQPPNYDYSAAPARRRSRRHSRVARKGIRIIKAAFYLLALGGLAASLWVFAVSPLLLKDEDLSVRAAREMAEERYGAASQTYLQLASRMAPGDMKRSDAEFLAAHVLTLGPEASWDEFSPRYQTALALFKQFIEDYPQHPKRARALSIMGRLYFELKDFEQAIVVLRDQVKPADDPAAALSMLRYLARAYSMTGNYDHAETSYLQAATLPGNYSAELDYLELGDLFRRRAEGAKDGADREKLKEMAMSYWRRAMQVPGIAPGDRSNLEERLTWLSFTERAGEAGAAASDAQPQAAPGADVPAEGVVAAPESAIPVPLDETGRAEIPGAEIEALLPEAKGPAKAPLPAPAPESH